jgi:hypothetical protein
MPSKQIAQMSEAPRQRKPKTHFLEDQGKRYVLALTRSEACKESLKDTPYCEILTIDDFDGFKSFAEMNRSKKPIFVIDVGDGGNLERTIERARWVKENFPENLRISTGNNPYNAAQLMIGKRLCQESRTHILLSSFLQEKALA